MTTVKLEFPEDVSPAHKTIGTHTTGSSTVDGAPQCGYILSTSHTS